MASDPPPAVAELRRVGAGRLFVHWGCVSSQTKFLLLYKYQDTLPVYLMARTKPGTAQSRSLTSSSMQLLASVAGVKLETHPRVLRAQTCVVLFGGSTHPHRGCSLNLVNEI